MADARNSDEWLDLVVALAEPDGRAAAARSLARCFGADDLIVFVRDPEIGRLLPGTGFPQTLRGGRQWRDLVELAAAKGSAEATLTAPDGAQRGAVAVGHPAGTVAVLLGGAPDDAAVAQLGRVLPLLGRLLRTEVEALRAAADAAVARETAARAAELAEKLDTTRAELQHAAAVAELATRARDEFLATVSHELRTPLTSIIGWVQLLQASKDPAAISVGLETVERNARAQSRLIEDILDFSRINAGKLRLDVRPLELPDVIRAAVEVVRPAADAKGVTLDCVLDPNSGHVSGDPDRLQQVVWNLLSNGVKFTPRGGRVQVRLERVNSHCELTVSDTGEGISPEFIPYVFDRFSQADSGSTRTHAGLGLGLGIVRHLVEMHGGTVQAFSAGLGKGSTFAVRLPLLVAHEHRAQDAVNAAAAKGAARLERPEFEDLTGIRIVIAEDNDDARKLLVAILSRAGAQVEAAPNVEDALQLLMASAPDIVVSDIEMPGEDGYSFIRKIRLIESPLRHVPAIALTAYTRGVDRVRALSAGFQVHMAKPVEPAELVAAIKSLVSTSRREGGS